MGCREAPTKFDRFNVDEADYQNVCPTVVEVNEVGELGTLTRNEQV